MDVAYLLNYAIKCQNTDTSAPLNQGWWGVSWERAGLSGENADPALSVYTGTS